VPAPTIAASGSIGEELGGQNEQPGVRVVIARVAMLDGDGVRGEDDVAILDVHRQTAHRWLRQRSRRKCPCSHSTHYLPGMTSVPDRARVRLAELSPRAYEHSADRAALSALRKVRGFDQMLRWLAGLFAGRAPRLLAQINNQVIMNNCS